MTFRKCQHITCDKYADLFWHGPWCAFHADQNFGRVPSFIAELAWTSADRQAEAAVPVRRPPRARVEADPSPEAASPAPLSDWDLERLLATNGWDLMDAELACITALGLDF